ncbi:hypothetical protein [Rothia terrae]|uniref:hypothetical protein n=1 Tax=Rothia terrae TaxID=396015 RepID=UPI002881C05C|nr:hypothetical protein [Rothia terrae]MDT0189353.1 hypothetical protein [Rothia terrae]
MRGLAPHDASSSRASSQLPTAHGSANSKGLAAGKLGLASPPLSGSAMPLLPMTFSLPSRMRRSAL